MKVMSVLDLRPRKLGSFEEYTLALSRSLTHEGHESVLVFKELPPDSLRPQYLEVGAILETKPFAPFGRDSASALRTLLRRHRPEVVHFHFVNLLSLDVAAAALNRDVKVVFSDHASDVPKDRSVLRWHALRASKRAFSSLVDRVIAPSGYVKARLVRQGVNAERITVIHNGVNLEKFHTVLTTDNVRATYGVGPGSVVVASISQLIPEKGIGYLIDAAELALKQGADLTFIHVGDGPCAAEYRARTQRAGIDNRFIFAGLLNLPEVAAILRASDIFTLPCTWGEAFSLVILEALAAGKPVIATRVGGNPEAVEDGKNGLVIPPRDAKALAAAIMSLHDSPRRREVMAQESAMRSAYFSVQRWVDETMEVYNSMEEVLSWTRN
jgi:glycosyltransferase involved in cell wall biosynthesis